MIDVERLALWATWTGRHGLPIFFAMPVPLLAETCAGWSVLQRTHVPCTLGTLRTSVPLGLRTAVGRANIVLGAGIFAELAAHLAAAEELRGADQTPTGL